MIPPPHVYLHQLDPDVHVAGEVVSLDVEVDNLLLRCSVELVEKLLAVAVVARADIGLYPDRVVLADLESLDCQLHAVVALLQDRVHHSRDAVPDHVVLGELAVIVGEVVVVVLVGLAVVVPVVAHLALPAVADVSAVVVGAVVVLHLVVHPVVGQVERRGRLLARRSEGEGTYPHLLVVILTNLREYGSDGHDAGEVVSLDVEVDNLLLRCRVELVEQLFTVVVILGSDVYHEIYRVVIPGH